MHEFEETLADRQAQPGPAKFPRSGCVPLAEWLEQAFASPFVNADASVLDHEPDLDDIVRLPLFGNGQFDEPLMREFDTVGQEIRNDLSHPPWITENNEIIGHLR